jgi:hypothetical protein
MALMASKSDAFVDPNSRFELKTCVEYLWLPVFIIWLFNIICLLSHYHLCQCRSNRTVSENVTNDTVTSEPPIVVTLDATELFQLRQSSESGEQTPSILSRTSPLMIDRSVSVPSFPSLTEQMEEEEEESFQPSESRLFKVILFILIITVIALLFASNDKTYFDIGM